MLKECRKNVEKRAVSGILTLARNAAQPAKLTKLMKKSPAEEESP